MKTVAVDIADKEMPDAKPDDEEVDDGADEGGADKKKKKKKKKSKGGGGAEADESEAAANGGSSESAAIEAGAAAMSVGDGGEAGDGGEEGGGEVSAAKKKRDKQKAAAARKKAEAAAGGEGGGAAAGGGGVPIYSTEPEWSSIIRGIKPWGKYPTPEKGGTPQRHGGEWGLTTPVLEQFPSGEVPHGLEVEYNGSQQKRITNAEKRELERLHNISYNEVRGPIEKKGIECEPTGIYISIPPGPSFRSIPPAASLLYHPSC